MNNDFWKFKSLAFLHDPPRNPLVFGKGAERMGEDVHLSFPVKRVKALNRSNNLSKWLKHKDVRKDCFFRCNFTEIRGAK